MTCNQRRITYAGGGHPPVFLITGETAEAAELKMLESTGPMIGAIDGLEFDCESIDVGHYGRLFLYSDGVYEVHLAGRRHLDLRRVQAFMGQLTTGRPGYGPVKTTYADPFGARPLGRRFFHHRASILKC